MGNKLYVGNLPYDTNEDDLTALFAQAGTVSTVNVMRDRETGRARGFAFVEMATDQEAQTAINQLHEHSFGGRTLTVNEARPQQPRSGGGGGFGGGGGGRGGRGGGGGGGGGGRRQEPRW
jgi:cold-inducible RNA-binding protein